VSASQPNIGIDRPVLGTVGTDGHDPVGRRLRRLGQRADRLRRCQDRFLPVRCRWFRRREGPGRPRYLVAGADGSFSGTITLASGAFALGQSLTATATDADGNTSEFADNKTRACCSRCSWVRSTHSIPPRPRTFVSGTIGTKTAGNSFNIAVVAIDRTGSAVATSWTGTVQIEWMDATDNSGTDPGTGWPQQLGPAWLGGFGHPRQCQPGAGEHRRSSRRDAGRNWRLRLTATVGANTVPDPARTTRSP
jgi:hypothetical protein